MKALWAFLPVAAFSQSGDYTLGRTLARIEENQKRLPHYVCSQSIERRRKGELSSASEQMDRLRVDVAVIGKKESFAWPGAGAFNEQGLLKMVGNRGLALEGDYAALADAVFLSGDTDFQREPDTAVAGRRALRFSYRIRNYRSGIRLRMGDREAMLKHQGAFQVDAETLDLLRLEVEAGEIPRGMDLESARIAIEYQRVRMGDSDFTLPARTEVETVTRHGVESRNRTAYTGCRQYAASSLVRFDGGEEEAAQTAVRPGAAAVPAGAIITSALTEPVDFSSGAAGDEITFTVLSEVRREGLRIPKGALLRGRITELSSLLAPNRLNSLRCRLDSVEIEGRQVPLRAHALDARRLGDRALRIRVVEGKEGESALLIDPTSRSSISRGTQFTWETVP